MESDGWVILASVLATACALVVEGVYWMLTRASPGRFPSDRRVGAALSVGAMGIAFFVLSNIPDWRARLVVTMVGVCGYAYFRVVIGVPELLGAPTVSSAGAHKVSRVTTVDSRHLLLSGAFALAVTAIGAVSFPEVRVRALVFGVVFAIPFLLLLWTVIRDRRGQ